MATTLRIGLLALAAASSLLAPGATARAEDLPRHRISGLFQLGFGGEVDLDGLALAEDDLQATVGLGARYEAIFHEYVGAGALFLVSFWKGEDMNDRNNLFDLDVFVRGLYPIEMDMGVLELYVLFPVGLTVSTFDQDNGGSVEKSAAGWNLGLLFGANLAAWEHGGIFVELGFMHHSAKHNVALFGRELEGTITQAVLQLGGYYQL